MTEAEVILRLAMHYINNHLTEEHVMASIDGAHVKTGNTVRFDNFDFLRSEGFEKVDAEVDRWQGEYLIDGYDNHIINSIEGRKNEKYISCVFYKNRYGYTGGSS